MNAVRNCIFVCMCVMWLNSIKKGGLAIYDKMDQPVRYYVTWNKAGTEKKHCMSSLILYVESKKECNK